MMKLTQDMVRKLFEYRDGCLYWRVKPCVGVSAGDRAGSVHSSGYRVIGIGGSEYKEHRIIYLLHHGSLPAIVDHVDGDRLNNRPENLRAATQGENQRNRRRNKQSQSGVKGVTWHARDSLWHVRVQINGARKSFGFFKDIELAALVADEARRKYHREFACHG